MKIKINSTDALWASFSLWALDSWIYSNSCIYLDKWKEKWSKLIHPLLILWKSSKWDFIVYTAYIKQAMIQHKVSWCCPLENLFNKFVGFLLVCNTHFRLPWIITNSLYSMPQHGGPVWEQIFPWNSEVPAPAWHHFSVTTRRLFHPVVCTSFLKVTTNAMNMLISATIKLVEKREES